MEKKCFLMLMMAAACMCALGQLSPACANDSGEIAVAGKIGYFIINGGDLKEPDFEDVFNDYSGNGLMLGGELDYYFNRLMGLALMVDYYNQEEKFGFMEYSAFVQQRMVPVSLNFKLRLPLVIIKPYAGAGVGLYFWDAKAGFSGGGTDIDVSEKGTDAGFNLFGGLQFSPGALISLFGEVRYHYVGDLEFIDREDLDFLSEKVRTDLSGVQISGGIVLSF